MIAPFALLAAALFTRSLGTFISVPDWQPTADIPSAFHAYGTYNDGSGSTEYWRTTSTNAAAVNALFDGAYERAWLGRDYGIATNAVGIRADWDADFDAPRVITNSFRLLSWSNLAATATALAHGDHRGWAADFGGDDLRALRVGRVEPPVGADWRATFPCDTNGYPNVTADAWVDVFPCFSMLAEDDGSVYNNVATYPRRHLGAWLGFASAAAGGVGSHWLRGTWGDVLDTPLGGAIRGYAQEGVFYAPQTPTDLFAVNVPRRDAVRLSRHFDAVVEVYTNAAVYVTNDLVRAVTNITVGIVGTNVGYKVYYWRAGDTSRLSVTNLTDLPPPVEIATNVHHIITNRAPIFAAVTNAVYHLRDLAFDVRRWSPDGQVTTNNMRRLNIRTAADLPERAELTNSVAVVTNATPASLRLDWYKAGALDRFEGAMTSAYGETNDLHLCRGRREDAIVTYAFVTNAKPTDVTLTFDEYGGYALDTNDFTDIVWDYLPQPATNVQTSALATPYHPTFRASAVGVSHTAAAILRSPLLENDALIGEVIEQLTDNHNRLGPLYDGLGFEFRGRFVEEPNWARWKMEIERIIYADGETNSAPLVVTSWRTFSGSQTFPASVMEFDGTLAKSAAAVIYDRVDGELLPDDATLGTSLARVIPPRPVWSAGYVRAATVYTLDALLTGDAVPVLTTPFSDPADDFRAADVTSAIYTGFRIRKYTDAVTYPAAVGALTNRYADLAAQMAVRTAADVDGRQMSAAPWAAANAAEIARFGDPLPWRPHLVRLEWGMSALEGTHVKIIGEVESVSAAETNIVFTAVKICDDSYVDIDEAVPGMGVQGLGWLAVEIKANASHLPIVETRDLAPYPRTTRYSVDAHEMPLIRTDWKWRCLTPTD